jgi:hypothetical protein
MKSNSVLSQSPSKSKNGSKSRTIMSSYAMNNDMFNIDEMMTKNKLKKFREIGGTENLNSSSNNASNASK